MLLTNHARKTKKSQNAHFEEQSAISKKAIANAILQSLEAARSGCLLPA